MLKLCASLIICAALAVGGASAEETSASDTSEAKNTRAIKVKTRTQKLADACGAFDEAKKPCQRLRKACKKPVNNSKPECTALPAQEAASTEGEAPAEQSN